MPDRSRPTLTEVAARARVSTATVSRVLNGRPGVAEATRQRVVRLLGEIGYTTGEATGPALVGLIAPRLEDDTAGMVQAVQASLGAADLAPVLCLHHETGGLAWAIDTVLRRRVAGVVAIGPTRLSHQDLAALLRVAAAGLPLALIDIAAEVGATRVLTDVEEGLGRAVRHLAALGHQRLGLLAGTFDDRQVSAFRRTVPGGAVQVVQPSMASAVAGAEVLLDEGVTAVVGASDILALGVLKAATARGLDVPDDVSVVAAADSPLAIYADPALDALRTPAADVAQAGVDALVADLDRVRSDAGPQQRDDAGPQQRDGAGPTGSVGGGTAAVDHQPALLFAPDLVVRASSAAVRHPPGG